MNYRIIHQKALDKIMINANSFNSFFIDQNVRNLPNHWKAPVKDQIGISGGRREQRQSVTRKQLSSDMLPLPSDTSIPAFLW